MISERGAWCVRAVLICMTAGLAAACGSALDPNDVGRPSTAGGPVAAAPSTDSAGNVTTPTVAADPGQGGAAGSTPGAIDPGATTGPVGPGAPGATTGSGGGPAPTSGAGGGPTAGAPTGAASGPPSTSADACVGFKNTTGITDKTITIGNASDVSGPVPGLFEAAQDAMKAYVDYFNATSSICGRKLVLQNYDSKTDAGADQQAYAAACPNVFAMVGSTSAFDSGGASTAQSCGLPDLRTSTLTAARAACTTCYGSQSTNSAEFENAVADYVLKYYPDGAKHAAIVYLNAGSAAESGQGQMKIESARGLHYDYVAGIGTTEFNYAPYAQAIKDKGVKYVQFLGSYQASVRLQQALQQVGYKPDIYMQDPTVYDDGYVSSGGPAVDGTTVFTNFLPFAEAGSNPAMQTYLSYLQQSKPGAKPTFFGVFAWSAGMLFTQLATQLGGKLTRASLVTAMSKVDNWTAQGMTEPQHVGAKHNGECWRFLQLDGTTWVNGKSGAKPMCDGVGHV